MGKLKRVKALPWAVLLQGGAKLVLNIYRNWVGENAVRGLRRRVHALVEATSAASSTLEAEGIQASMIVAEVEPVGAFVGGSLSEPFQRNADYALGNYLIDQALFTWQEAVYGFVLGTIIGIILASIFVLGRPWWVGVVLAVGMVAAATAGDLAESMVKRELGVKDMSSILPGHGGVMDRLDSIVFAAPAAYILFALLSGA